MGKVVAIGDYGSQVFTCLEGSNGGARMLSSYASGTVTPVWQSSPVFEVRNAQVDAAETADIFASLTLQRDSASVPLQLVLSRYKAASATPVWQRTLPLAADEGTTMGVAISDDGATFVAWAFDKVQLDTKVFVYDSTGNLVLSKGVHTTYAPMGGSVSANGGLLYLTAPHWDIVLDLRSSQFLLESLTGASIGGAMGMSADGKIVASARGEGIIQLFRREIDTYVPWFSVTPPVAMTLCTALRISADGSTLACGFRNPFQDGALKIQVYDLISSSHSLLTEASFPESPSYVYFTALEMSADGRLIAAGTTGDSGGPIPELIVLERSAGGWRKSEMDLPCSVTDISMRERAKLFAVSVNGIAAAAGYTPWGEIRLFDAGEHDLRIEGVPTAGSTIVIEHKAGPGATARLFMASEMATIPLVYWFGTLHLDPGGIEIVDSVVADSSGVVRTSIHLPSGPAGIGRTFCFQGRVRRTRLSTDAIKVTVLP